MAVKNIGQPLTSKLQVGPMETTQTKDVAKLPKPIGSQSPEILSAESSVDVALSNDARQRVQERKKAKDLAMKSPDVREDRVSDIKSRIANGTYQVDSEKIAQGMIKEAALEHYASQPNRE
jgi:flagellar biosynthesis anti-sigma factor FlgM